ncbi:cytochrome C [Legionella pneumophila serogroup 1]
MKRNALIIMLVYLTSNPVFAKNLGKYTYEIACKNCHAPNLAKGIKAPPAFDKKAWKLRFKQAKIEAKNNPSQFESAMDYLLYNVKVGKGLMHHGGLCKEADVPNTDCSDEALIAAINYMRK